MILRIYRHYDCYLLTNASDPGWLSAASPGDLDLPALRNGIAKRHRLRR